MARSMLRGLVISSPEKRGEAASATSWNDPKSMDDTRPPQGVAARYLPKSYGIDDNALVPVIARA
jgi:hypothetical protein